MVDVKQKGFGITLAIVAVAVLIAAGVMGWSVYSDKKSQNTIIAQPTNHNHMATNNNESQRTIDAYSGWKTYTASLKKYSFLYPADWAVSRTNQNDIEAVTLNAPQRTIDGANNQFSLTFRIFKPLGIDTTQSTIFSATSLTANSFSQKLYAVISGAADDPRSPDNGKALNITASNTKYPLGAHSFKDVTILTDTDTGQEVEFSGGYVKSTGKGQNIVSYFDPVQFSGLEDVQTAMRIFDSLSDK